MAPLPPPMRWSRRDPAWRGHREHPSTGRDRRPRHHVLARAAAALPGTPEQVAGLLRQLHALPQPSDPLLLALDPFVRIRERLDGSNVIPDDDRQWLLERLDDHRAAYTNLPTGLRHAPVHGDAWTGNVLAVGDGTVILIDLERFSFGPPEGDLVSTATRYASYGTLDAHDYRAFTDTYGHDVIPWPGYPTLRDIRELRVVAYAVQLAGEHPDIRDQALHRIACLRGLRSPRPWTGWHALA